VKEDKNNTNDDIIPDKPQRPIIKILVPVLVIAVIFGIWAYKNLLPASDVKDEDTSEFALDATEDFNLEEILSHGLPVLIDFGADYCAPCREMAPILDELNKEYRGRAVIKFVDIQKNPRASEGFGITVIPTQFFFDKEGTPYSYHEGFLSRENIIRAFEELGVE
jgi:thioredoxin 1